MVLLPNDAELRHTAAAAAEQVRAEGVRVALIPTRSAVQGIAALAVHEPERRFDEDVVAMTSAAGATRYAEVTVAERQSWTMAGICQAATSSAWSTATWRSSARTSPRPPWPSWTACSRPARGAGHAGGRRRRPESVAERLQARVREGYLAVDTVAYHGGKQGSVLLIGVE